MQHEKKRGFMGKIDNNYNEKIVLPCHFGLEAVLKREAVSNGFEVDSVSDGRVALCGGAEDAARANVLMRTAERVMIECANFEARTFDELFEKTKAIPWENYIPKDGKFWVAKASSVSSALFSPRDIQSIIKKAMVKRLEGVYGISVFPEDGESYPFRVSINKDIVSICLDTSGDSLHKRGYRVSPVLAPISETLAAGLVLLTPWRRGRILCDPCCGSGTIPIEAAMIARNIAPGLKRSFQMEKWDNLNGAKLVSIAKEEAESVILPSAESDIQGFDIDASAAKFSRDNAKAAGVESDIHFQARSIADFSHPGKYGFVISNPPYGERLSDDDEIKLVYENFGRIVRDYDTWSVYMITSYSDAEKIVGKKADKNRKIYNGMIESRFYQYMGKKPPKRKD